MREGGKVREEEKKMVKKAYFGKQFIFSISSPSDKCSSYCFPSSSLQLCSCSPTPCRARSSPHQHHSQAEEGRTDERKERTAEEKERDNQSKAR